MKDYTLCQICPRACKVDRNQQKGFCNENRTLRIAKIIKNFQWEEPCITGEKGTLAIFFSGCNLRCDYCQNFAISRGGMGKIFSIEEFCSLIEKNQNNHSSIDLITPTHFSDILVEAFEKINKKIPVVWNTNGYETTENINKVSKFVDVFLTDFKYGDDETGKNFSKCNDYFSIAKPAIIQMCKLKPDIIENDFMKQGVVIRHLVLPDLIKNSFKVLDEIKRSFSERKISLMSQFTPNGHSVLNRPLKPIEYKAVLSHMQKLCLENGYIQDLESSTDRYVPDFL